MGGTPGMQWNKQQRDALDIVHKRLKDREPVTRLFGYAGVGKTTLAKELAAGAGGNVVFAAYTGKAASVLTRKGCPASTIHSLIYKPAGSLAEQAKRLEEDIARSEALGVGEDLLQAYAERLSEIRKQLKRKGNSLGFSFSAETSVLGSMYPRPKLLVLDEVSMVDLNMAKDLLSFDIPILALGDPAQLPPVGNGGYFTKGGESAADALLTQVERHDGPVIELATRVREGRLSSLPIEGEMVRRKIGQSEAADFDQVLVGTNATRWAKNRTLRKLAGLSPGVLLAPGDRIICLGNNKDMRVMNGQQFGVLEVGDSSIDGQIFARLICECLGIEESQRDACPLCGWEVTWLPVWMAGFEGIGGERELSEMAYGRSKSAMLATYGYAITTHKAQGSEWGSVLVVNEARVFRKDGWRWLYTAVTRAQEKVVVLK